MKTIIFINLILVSSYLSSLSPINLYTEWDNDPFNKRVYKGQGASDSCQTFAITRGVQLCINHKEGNENVEFDALAYFNQEFDFEPNEYHVCHSLYNNGIKDVNSDRRFKLSSYPKYKGVAAKNGYDRPGFSISHEKGGYQLMKYIDEQIGNGPVAVGVNLKVFNWKMKEMIKERQAENDPVRNIGLASECSKKGAQLTHVMLITKKKKYLNKNLYTVIDSSGDPSLGFGVYDSFVMDLTYDEVLNCLSFTVTPINCKEVIEE